MARFEPMLPGNKYCGTVYGINNRLAGRIKFEAHPNVESYVFYPFQDSSGQESICAKTLRDIADALDSLNGNGKNGG